MNDVKKYKPKIKKELQELVTNKDIKLSDIDISNITDMSYLFDGLNRKDFTMNI